MRILIVEEALETGAGHWPHYIGGLAAGFRAAGDDVDVLVHREATDAVVEQVGGTRWLRRNCWLDSRSQGRVGGLQHSWFFYRDVLSWLGQQEHPYDWILVLTMRHQHLPAVAKLSRELGNTKLLLLFVQGFGVYCGMGKPVAFPQSASNRLARFCFRMMGEAVRRGQCVLGAETEGMRQELEQFSGLPAKLFPHPVPVPEVGEEEDGGSGEIVLTAPGFARHEKGSDLLRTAIEGMLRADDLPPVRFILQWAEPFAVPEGGDLGPGPILEADPRVELVNESLGAEAYFALLRRSDLVLLPYRRNSYHNRLSRVAIEAAGMGRPLIYMKGTWSGEVADIAGTGIGIEEETAASIEEAMRSGIEDFAELRQEAKKGAVRVTEFHTAESFRKCLPGEGAR